MKSFAFHSPKTLDEAIALFGPPEKNSRYIAGGTDVIVKIKDEWMAPDHLVSLKQIKDLHTLERDESTGALRIGAMVTHRQLERSDMIKSHYPIIYDAVSNIGSVQVRNIATIGGNLVNAVPSADSAIPMIALDGAARIRGPKGERTVSLTDFFLGPYQTVLEPGEILVDITTSPQEPDTGSAYIKFGRRAAMELPLLGVGVLLGLDRNQKTCTRARICLGVAAPTPMRAREAENLLIGKPLDEALLEEAGLIEADESRVRDSFRGKAWHRKEMVKVLVRRMGLKCLEIAMKEGSNQ